MFISVLKLTTARQILALFVYFALRCIVVGTRSIFNKVSRSLIALPDDQRALPSFTHLVLNLPGYMVFPIERFSVVNDGKTATTERGAAHEGRLLFNSRTGTKLYAKTGLRLRRSEVCTSGRLPMVRLFSLQCFVAVRRQSVEAYPDSCQ